MDNRFFKYGDKVRVSETLSGKVIGYNNNGKSISVLLTDGSIRTLLEKELIALNND